MLVTAVVVVVILALIGGSLYSLYQSVLEREDSYDVSYGDFDGPESEDYLTDEEWEQEPKRFDGQHPEF